MKSSIIFLSFFVLISFSGCKSKDKADAVANNESYNAVAVEEAAPATEPDMAETGNNKESADNDVVKPTKDIKKKIIKDGMMSIRSAKISDSKQKLDDLLKKYNAYYESEDLSNTEQMITYTLKIRISADNFEKLIADIEKGKDEIESKSINARDVTEEYLDTEARLNNKKAYLERYKNLLNKANTVKEILEIEENIRNLQEEIESKEGRLKYLNDQIAFSTLNVTLYENKEYVYKPEPKDSFWERVKQSLGNGWTAIVNFIIWIISGWPFWLIILTIIYFVRKLIKKRRNKQK